MDKLCENAQRYSEILQKCNSAEVSNWKAEDLERAFHWAGFFKKVHGRISQKQSLVQRFDAQLRKIGQQLRMRFGEEELSYEFLAHSSDYLTKALIENPSLPKDLHDRILNDHASDSLLKYLDDLQASNTLLKTLSSIHEKLTECQPEKPPCPSTLDASGLLHVDAMCLVEDIGWQLKYSPIQSIDGSLQKLLEGLAEQDTGMEVILLSLTESEMHHPFMDPHHHANAQAAILKWLLQELSPARPTGQAQAQPGATAEKLWKQSPKLLAQVSKRHLAFFKLHIQYLVKKMEQFEMDFCPTSMISDCQTVAEEFEEVVTHFHQLVLSGDNVKDVCTSLVRSRALPIEGDSESGSEDKLPSGGWRKLYLRLNVSNFES